jgi:hypothetical protein
MIIVQLNSNPSSQKLLFAKQVKGSAFTTGKGNWGYPDFHYFTSFRLEFVTTTPYIFNDIPF